MIKWQEMHKLVMHLVISAGNLGMVRQALADQLMSQQEVCVL